MNTDKTYAEQVASEYAPKKESKVVALRKLDQKAKRPALIFAYTFGTISVLFSFTKQTIKPIFYFVLITFFKIIHDFFPPIEKIYAKDVCATRGHRCLLLCEPHRLLRLLILLVYPSG